MKVSIEVGHGWCGAISKCKSCDSVFTLIRQRKAKAEQIKCPVCKKTITIEELETPWVGLIEDMK